MNSGVLLDERPVEPRDFIILAVAIIVAALTASYLISHQQHRRAGCQQRERQQVLYLALAQARDLRIIGRTLNTAVPAEIVVRAVAVIFAVGFIVFIIERHQVM